MDPQASKPPRIPIRAAQYVRMSTDHQQYSTENQADVIARYIEHLLSNPKIEKYLTKHHSDILGEFKKQVQEKDGEIPRPITGLMAKSRALTKARQEKGVEAATTRSLAGRKVLRA